MVPGVMAAGESEAVFGQFVVAAVKQRAEARYAQVPVQYLGAVRGRWGRFNVDGPHGPRVASGPGVLVHHQAP